MAPVAGALWDRWFAHASPAQRQRALSRAAADGLLYAHELPPPEGAGAAGPDLLALLDQTPAPFAPPPLDAADDALDDDQRHAAARAAHTPDVALLLGYPGSGKSRVVTEVLRQAIRAGRRVLFTAPSAAAVDRALGPLSGDADLRAARLLGPKELPGRVPACVARLCPAEQARHCREQALPAARTAAASAQAALAARRRDADVWPRLAELAAQAAVTDQEAVGPPADEDLPRRQAVRLDAERQLAESRANLAQLEALDQARQQAPPPRWWSLAYWFGGSRPTEAPEQVEARRAGARAAVARLETLLAQADEQEKALVARHAELTEAHRRQHAEAARRETEQHESAWRGAVAALSAGTAPPAARTPEAVEAARAAWAAALARDEAESEARQGWLDGLTQALPGLEAQLAEEAQLVAGPVTAFLGDAEKATGFDLVVVDEAPFVREADLIELARRARACVLVGEPAPELPLAPPPRGTSRARPVSLFHRLWARLHRAPADLPARWRHRGGRLVATLREASGPLQREPVTDRPDVELAFQSGADPRVVEVSFPAGTTVADAKAYLYHESGELAVEADGPAPRWREDDAAVSLQLSAAEGEGPAVALEPGLAEHLTRRAAGDGWVTARLTFARSAGWDRARAEAWAEERLGLRDLGRTAVLTRTYRARPALARWVAELLHGGGGEPAGEPAGTALPGPAVELVAVAGAPPRDARPNGPPARGAARPPRGGGAGLEIDLGGGTRGDGLPAELRRTLPAQGVVNLAEARAVVAELERLVSDASFRAAAAAWHARPGARRCDVNAATPACPAVAVIGLLPEQADLLRVLVTRSAVVGSSGVAVEVGTPLRLAQRECLVALVSLTRSHTHRAVPFTEHPDDLLLALTRPAGRLVLFGDPGTMARRGQWNGALDHLDEITGPVEQALLTQLLARWPEPEAPARAARPRESSSV